MYDHPQGARSQYFVQSPNWIPLMYVHCLFVWSSMTSSHPNSSSGHTYKPMVMTYGRIPHKQTTNVHQWNPIWWLHKVLIANPLKMVIH